MALTNMFMTFIVMTGSWVCTYLQLTELYALSRYFFFFNVKPTSIQWFKNKINSASSHGSLAQYVIVFAERLTLALMRERSAFSHGVHIFRLPVFHQKYLPRTEVLCPSPPSCVEILACKAMVSGGGLVGDDHAVRAEPSHVGSVS